MRYRFAGHELDDRLFTLTPLAAAGGSPGPVALRRQALDLLLYLVRHRDRVVSREELDAHLWPDTRVGASSLATAVREVRNALGDDARSPSFLQTLYGRGYRFVGEVEERPEASAPGRRSRDRLAALGRLFVGREATLALLEGGLARSVAGASEIALVSGEMGIGKSRTAEELARRAEDAGHRVVHGRAEGASGAPAYWPWRQALSQLADRGLPPGVLAGLGPGAADLAGLVPGLQGPGPAGEWPGPGAGDPQTRLRLFDAVERLLRAAAAALPVVLVLEDLHAADASSLDLLHFLARGGGDLRVFFVCTVRDAQCELDPERSGRLPALLRESRVVPVPLSGLGRDEVRRYLEAASGAPPARRVVDALLLRSGGNPFFLHQLVLHLVAGEGVEALEREPGSGRTLPVTLREAVRRQLAHLPAACGEVLSLAAVLGRDFAAAPLRELAGEDAEGLLARLQPALDAGVVGPHPERHGDYRFAHMLVRDALYDALPQPERARLHGRAGEALEKGAGAERHAVRSELSHHFFEAARVGGEDRALEACLAAAEAARGEQGHAEAALHLGRVLRLVEMGAPVEDRRRCDILIELGRAQTRAGRRDAAEETIARAAELARALGDPERLARAALSLEEGFFSIESGRVDRRLIALLEEALVAMAGRDPVLESHLAARLAAALHWVGDPDAAPRLARGAARRAEACGDPRARLHAACAEYEALADPLHLGPRLECGARVIALAEALGDPETLLLHRLHRLTSLLEAARPEEARREAVRFAALSESLRQPQSAWYPTLFASMEALRRGRLREVEPLAARFLALSRRADDRNAVQAWGCQLVYLRWQCGRLGEVVDLFESLAHRFEGFPPWRFAHAVLHTEVGRLDEAREALWSAWPPGDPGPPRNSAWLVCAALSAHAAAALGDRDLCERLHGELAPFAGRVPVIGYGVLAWGTVGLQLGRLAAAVGDLDPAVEQLEAAVQEHERLEARPFAVLARLDAARTLERRDRPGDRARARLHAARAREEGRALGLAVAGPTPPASAARAG